MEIYAMINVWERQSVQGTLQPIMQKAQGRIARLYNAKGYPCMISSRNDSEHMQGSFHYIDLAEDYFDPNKYVPLEDYIYTLKRLNPGFQVFESSWGYHVEYDPE